MKYIDAEKLIHDLVERIHAYSKEYVTGDNYRKDAIEILLEDVKHQLSLRKEQADMALENEINAVWNPRFNLGWDEHSALSMNHDGFADIARHFYELGQLNTREREQ